MRLPRAVLLDALGTLLRLEPPGPALRDALARRGVEVGTATARRAMEAEIAFYRAHMLEGRDAAGLARLRRRCAAVLARELGDAVRALDPAAVEAALLEALRFRPWDDAAPALSAMARRGTRLVVVSNWDVSLHERLAESGLAAHLHAAVASAEAGVAKPDPAIFHRALELAGVRAAEALHAGDSLAEDVQGARAAGIDAVLVRRGPGPPAPAGVATVSSLSELPGVRPGPGAS